MPKDRSWWRLRQIRHRDAVVLAILSSACLLAGEVGDSNLPNVYRDFIAPYLNQPPVLVVIVLLLLLGFTTYFGGIFVLLGGLHFSWGRVGRGRFLVGLGLGVSLLGLTSRLAKAILTTGRPFGNPLEALLALGAGLTGLGIFFGIGSHTLMGKYALMLKKHARRIFRRWRKARQAERPSSRGD